MTLPLEIRQQIYRCALPYSIAKSCSADSLKSVHLDIFKERYHGHPGSPVSGLVRWYAGNCPRIVFANRQMHEEACEILYHENTFPIYVKHPRHPRLPLNESRADDDSFIYIPWEFRSWSHPRNPKIPLSVIRTHRHFSQLCRLHVNLPEMRDLSGADMYMRTTSYASHYGLSAWVEKLRTTGGVLSKEERERMDYINQIKQPIDEVAGVLRLLPRINEFVIFFKSESYEVAFIEYVASGLLQLRCIRRARCLYWPAEGVRYGQMQLAKLRDEMMEPRLHSLERQLESRSVPTASKSIAGLSPDALEMLKMLEAMRKRMLLIRELRSDFTNDEVDQTLPVLTNIIGEL